MLCGLLAGGLAKKYEDLQSGEARRGSASEAAERCRGWFDQTPLPLAIADAEGRILELNQRFRQVFGYQEADLPTLADWWRLAYPDAPNYRADIIAGWRRAMERAAGCNADIQADIYRVTCKNGEERIVRIIGRVLPDGVLAAFFDITEQHNTDSALRDSQAKALEQQRRFRLATLNQMQDANAARAAAEAAAAELRESQERLQMLIDHAPAALAMFDRDMCYLAVSQRWLEDYGLVGRSLLGESHYQVFPEIDEAGRDVHRRALAGEIVRADEDRLEKAGRIDPVATLASAPLAERGRRRRRHCHFFRGDYPAKTSRAGISETTRLAAIEDQRRASIAAMNLMEDALAERQLAESANVALRESEQRLLLAQEGAHVGIWEWNLETGELYWSPEYERLYGVEPGGPRSNEDWRARVHPDDLPLVDAGIGQQYCAWPFVRGRVPHPPRGWRIPLDVLHGQSSTR